MERKIGYLKALAYPYLSKYDQKHLFEEEGSQVTEYIMLAAVIVLGVIGAVLALTGRLDSLLNSVTNTI